MGPQVSTAHCLGTWIGPECALDSLAKWNISVALQTGEAMGYLLSSHTTVGRAAEFAVRLPISSGYVPWSDRLKAAFSDKGGYIGDSLPGCSGKSSSEARKALFVVLTQLTCTCLISSACQPLSWSVASRSCKQPFRSDGAEDTLQEGNTFS